MLLFSMKDSKYSILSLFALVVLVRLYFLQTYYGWEESDYGNLAMVYGVWESGFTHFDMNHMPGYYFVGALAYAVCHNSIWAALSVSVVSGLGSLLVVVKWAKKWGFDRGAVLVLLALLCQPEFILYSSSSLREPLYTLFVLLALSSLLEAQPWRYGLWAVLAFSVRFEAPLFVIPMLLLAPFGWRDRLKSLSVVLAGVLLWMLYCWAVYETPFFWRHAASVNVETGLGLEAQSFVEWFTNGLVIVWGLLTEIAPNHVGHGLILAWLMTPVVWKDSKRILSCWVWSMLMTGVWLGIAFVAQHEVGHNLYWKWMYPLVPFWVLCAVVTLSRATPKWVWGLVMVQAIFVQTKETHRQWELSEELYGPQIRLAKWMEGNLDPKKPLLVDNVPACWLRRDATVYTLHSWFDVPLFTTEEDLIRWAKQEDVHWVLFFKEEWTQAPAKARFLLNSTGTIDTTEGQIVLVEEETQYGWKWYHLTW